MAKQTSPDDGVFRRTAMKAAALSNGYRDRCSQGREEAGAEEDAEGIEYEEAISEV